MAFEPGDVVLVPFPYRDAAAVKTRPAVVVSSSDFNQAGDVWVVAITSHAPRSTWDHSLLDWQTARLQFGGITHAEPRKTRKLTEGKTLRHNAVLQRGCCGRCDSFIATSDSAFLPCISVFSVVNPPGCVFPQVVIGPVETRVA